ncbi:S9 family peptidase [bacterium SCSIO 12643]|nr:S9 family peptidase [bacterium SCSIO 12643]
MLRNQTTLVVILLFLGFSSFAQDKLITLDDIYTKNTFRSKRVWGLRSMHNGNYYTTITRTKEGQNIVKFSYTTGDSVETIFSTSTINQPFEFSDYQFSADESKIMFTTDEERIYRHSTREHVWIYDIKKSELKQISQNGKQRYTTFSPDGKKVAFVRNNNLYIYDLKSGKETEVTTDGEFNKIINGATDWVYEEEFAFDKAFTWAPDNKHIAYYRFDESQVKEFNMIMYQNQLYPKDYRFKYPKAGEDNSKVDIYIYNLKSNKSVKANFPQTEYVPRIKWASQNDLAIQTLNRHQNDLTIHFVDPISNTSHVVYHETSETYVEVVDDWFFLPDSRQMLITSEKDGYKHIYSINYQSGIEKQLTSGQWDVTNFYGVMEQSENIYFQSAEVSPMQRHIYKMDLKGNAITQLSQRNGWNNAAFSSNFLFYINTHSSANKPYTTTLNLENGKELAQLMDNKKLEATLAQYKISQKEFIKIPTSYGTELNGWMIKPADFDPNKKYPVLVTIYGGPGSQTVKDVWDNNMMWHHLLAQKGYIIVSVDNRGTGARGANFKKMTYQQLGKLEVEDYIETAKHLGSQKYIDPERIGIWGWSYGGYMSTLAISKGADYFKAAIAVAPVTTWRYYDNIYTERYMRTPQENPSGYDDNSPINFVEKIKGNYLLVHGTADDNVHFQNTAELVNALVNANVQYDFYMYTDKNHSIYGGNTRRHLFTKFTNFLLEKL